MPCEEDEEASRAKDDESAFLTADHETRYHLSPFLFSPLYYMIMRHDTGWEIPEQETARHGELVGLGFEPGTRDGPVTGIHTHIYI